MLCYKITRIICLAASLSACAHSLPKTPEGPLCEFTNRSDDGKTMLRPEDFYFKCLNAKNVRFEIKATSESADKMVAMPYQDFAEWLSYWAKIFEILKTQVLKKVGNK